MTFLVEDNVLLQQRSQPSYMNINKWVNFPDCRSVQSSKRHRRRQPYYMIWKTNYYKMTVSTLWSGQHQSMKPNFSYYTISASCEWDCLCFYQENLTRLRLEEIHKVNKHNWKCLLESYCFVSCTAIWSSHLWKRKNSIESEWQDKGGILLYSFSSCESKLTSFMYL